MSSKIYSDITNAIIAGIEAGTKDWQMPWHRSDKELARPVNVDTGKAYQGMNVLLLWTVARAAGFEISIWGTVRQWKKKGYQVRKGEIASFVVSYWPRKIMIEDETGAKVERTISVPGGRHDVFNAEQIDGYELPSSDPFPAAEDRFPPVEEAERFVAGTGATVTHRGDRAFYRSTDDRIVIPKPGSFIDTEHSTAAENYYSTLLHELIHWSGAPDRCNRKFGKRFGDHAYAFEELVAELGAAFLCVDLQVSLEPRPDHSQYIDSWLKVLKNDNSAIFVAAGNAAGAIRFLSDCQPSEQATTD